MRIILRTIKAKRNIYDVGDIEVIAGGQLLLVQSSTFPPNARFVQNNKPKQKDNNYRKEYLLIVTANGRW